MICHNFLLWCEYFRAKLWIYLNQWAFYHLFSRKTNSTFSRFLLNKQKLSKQMFIPFFVFGHFWRRSHKNTKKIHNLCLHFTRKDGQDKNNGKKITQSNQSKYQKPKDWNMRWTKQKKQARLLLVCWRFWEKKFLNSFSWKTWEYAKGAFMVFEIALPYDSQLTNSACGEKML